jgi:uncharacterized tellurite resistance protein B-like protein
MREHRDHEDEIEFASEALCSYCLLSDEEKEQIEKDKVIEITKRELKILESLNRKYKHLGENNE